MRLFTNLQKLFLVKNIFANIYFNFGSFTAFLYKPKLTLDVSKKCSYSNANLIFFSVLAIKHLDEDKRNSLVHELVSFLKLQTVKAELKLSDDNEESTTDSFPPDLVPQVDGVDSSAEGKSDDQQPQEDDQENHETVQEELNLPNVENNTNEQQSSSFHNATKCDKLKILSEMENKFAKETQNALKNRPVYKKRVSQKSESWDLKNGKELETSQDIPAKQIILMKEPGELEVTAPPTNVVVANQDSKHDENTPYLSSDNQLIAASSSSSSLTTTLKEFRLRKFRKGSRNSTSSSLVSPNSADEHMDDQEEGPPNITKTTPPTPPKVRITMSPPPLTPEVGPSAMSRGPLMIDIPDHYQSTPPLSSFGSGGYGRRLMIKTPPVARAGLVTMVSEAVLSKEDAEVAATAIQLSPPGPIPGHGQPGQGQPPISSINVTKSSTSGSSSSNEDHPSIKIKLPKVAPSTNLVIAETTTNTVNIPVTSAGTSTTPHVKKAPKRRHLNELSDGGIDTEEDEQQQDLHKRKRKDFEHQQTEKMSAGEDTDGGGKTTPDSQITNDDK